MSKRKAIVNVNLEYDLPDNVPEEEINDYLFDVDLPDNYLSGSFEIVKIIEE